MTATSVIIIMIIVVIIMMIIIIQNKVRITDVSPNIPYAR